MAKNISKCKACEADIVWMKTAKGNNIPVDAETVEEDLLGTPVVFDPDTMTSHFATCPSADKFRRKK
jgi:hypothetical protein